MKKEDFVIKCEVIIPFTLERFNELKNVKKVMERKEDEFGVRDTFECSKELADYLTGNNSIKEVVIKIIEVIPNKMKTTRKSTKK